MLNWPTWLMLITVGTSLSYRQGVWEVFVTEQPGIYIFAFGWPLIWREVWDIRTFGASITEYNWSALAVDLILSFVVLGSTLVVTEQLHRSKYQVGLGQALLFVAAIAVAFGLFRIAPQTFVVPVPMEFDRAGVSKTFVFVWCSRTATVLLDVGLVFTLFLVGQLMAHGAKRALRLLFSDPN